LNVDVKVQESLEKIVSDKTGVAIAMILKLVVSLSMVSHPSFDPNLFAQELVRMNITIFFQKVPL